LQSSPTGVDEEAERPFRVTAPDWVMELNRRYETIPERFRLWVVLAGLLLVGAINMTLTIHHMFPFGLLFLLVFLALFAIRGPYVAGWLTAAEPDLVVPEGYRRPLALVELPPENP
jgi:peptidoglycan/LPS O-acetylase OafA/YrhL